MASHSMQSLGEAIREISRRPSMHPYARHKTQAGPIRHEIFDSKVGGMVWMGMRKYGFVGIQLQDTDWLLEKIGKTKPRFWWRFDPEWKRVVRALARYRRSRYERDLMNAITTAWRC